MTSHELSPPSRPPGVEDNSVLSLVVLPQSPSADAAPDLASSNRLVSALLRRQLYDLISAQPPAAECYWGTSPQASCTAAPPRAATGPVAPGVLGPSQDRHSNPKRRRFASTCPPGGMRLDWTHTGVYFTLANLSRSMSSYLQLGQPVPPAMVACWQQLTVFLLQLIVLSHMDHIEAATRAALNPQRGIPARLSADEQLVMLQSAASFVAMIPSSVATQLAGQMWTAKLDNRFALRSPSARTPPNRGEEPREVDDLRSLRRQQRPQIFAQRQNLCGASTTAPNGDERPSALVGQLAPLAEGLRVAVQQKIRHLPVDPDYVPLIRAAHSPPGPAESLQQGSQTFRAALANLQLSALLGAAPALGQQAAAAGGASHLTAPPLPQSFSQHPLLQQPNWVPQQPTIPQCIPSAAPAAATAAAAAAATTPIAAFGHLPGDPSLFNLAGLSSLNLPSSGLLPLTAAAASEVIWPPAAASMELPPLNQCLSPCPSLSSVSNWDWDDDPLNLY
jgi:hypothetical protein